MPQYAIFIYSDTTAEHDAAELAEHDEHADDLIRSGALTAAYALRSPAAARSIRGSGITDGPYTESKELIAGIGIIEAPDLDAALALASRNPATRYGAGVEVREIEGAYVRDTGDADDAYTDDTDNLTAG
ncbi:YciI family protein [Leifsonia sp. 2TAF2]|uniref:YciI family protein n=1 Tax=Leifsonia sp. 2TAF2 TaxID=3233009 RepID=UPI003F96DDB8